MHSPLSSLPCHPQGGIHPDFTGDTYLRLLGAAKGAAPDIHVHAFRCAGQSMCLCCALRLPGNSLFSILVSCGGNSASADAEGQEWGPGPPSHPWLHYV